MNKVTSFGAALACLAMSLASPASAQTNEEVKRVYTEYVSAQRALGFNESCEVLDAGAQETAQSMTSQLRGPLQRVLKDQFKPDEIFEEARSMFEGCKTREEMPEAWTIIDYMRAVGAATVAAPSLAGLDLRECTQGNAVQIEPALMKLVADHQLSRYSGDQLEQLKQGALSLAARMKAACAKKPEFGFGRDLLPAVSAFSALRQYRTTPAGKSDDSLAVIPPPAGTITRSMGWRSEFSSPYSLTHVQATGYRYATDNRVAAAVQMPRSRISSGGGTLYFMRDGVIEAGVSKSYHQVLLKAVDSGATYPLERTNPELKMNFFSGEDAKFAMAKDVMQKLVTSHDEDAEFYMLYRETSEAGLAAFKRNQKDAKFKLGDFVRAFRWAMAPSALDQ